MRDPEQPPESGPLDSALSEPPRRKPYQKPAFLREQVFETMALACGKTNAVTRQCQVNRKNS